jgi:hypothetical protein
MIKMNKAKKDYEDLINGNLSPKQNSWEVYESYITELKEQNTTMIKELKIIYYSRNSFYDYDRINFLIKGITGRPIEDKINE